MKMQKPNNCLLVLPELEKAILEGDIDNFVKLSNLFDDTGNLENQVSLGNYYVNASNHIRSTNLVILACKHNQVKILEYLFGNNSRTLNNLSVGIGRTILPDDEDETSHNAFYYAIRLGNIELLDVVINKWPGNYFDVHLEELDEILSKAYEELKLKKVPLSEEMEIFVENTLINLRFFSGTFEQDQSYQGDFNNIEKRIQLMLENIDFLKINYSNMEEMDEKFLFVAKFIAQNMYTLKRQMKSTYDKLPWEEIEFCLVGFISFQTKLQEINLFYHATLSKSRLLNHLENFANRLEEEKDGIKVMSVDALARLPKLTRTTVVAQIINSHPQFEDLYNTYQQIRDIHSLEKISNNIKLALSADPHGREGQFIITRVLQVIGEHLKNTLESPKLSNTTSELFLLSLPKNARKIIVDIRNLLSHAYSLSKRIEMDENADVNYFRNIQSDIKKVGDVITDILFNSKFKTIRMLLKKIVNSQNLDEINEVAEVLRTVELDKTVWTNFQMLEHEKLAIIVKELSDNITDKTDYDKELLNKINSIIDSARTPSENIRTDYITGVATLLGLCISLKNHKSDHNVIKGMKFRANHTLKIITQKMEPCNFKEIANLAIKIFHSVGSRIQNDQLDEVKRLIYEIFNIVQFEIGNIKWIEELREKLNEKGSFIPACKTTKTYNITQKNNGDQLAIKLSELKSVLKNNSLNDSLVQKLSVYKSDKKLQAVIEMIILDIMSILDVPQLENNLLFLDDNTPLLIGKCLRNHLAHDNALFDILFDPSISIILNAKKIAKENKLIGKKKIGKLVSDNPFKLRGKYDQGLATITNQKKMFVAAEEGRLEILTDCLKKGSDINARSFNSWTMLHFAAKGPSLEIVKFILNHNVNVDGKDNNGQSPLHIAAAHGRKNIVEFFIKETHLNVDNLNNMCKTPLHVAAQNGHKDTVEVLIINKANTVAQDKFGFSPLHYAILNNHIDVAKFLLQKDANVDINEVMGGFTPLHGAAEAGHLEIVNFLLENKANVNARNDRNWIPLHAAALNGHVEVVNALILHGADVNARVIIGCTPLYYAVENGHDKIAHILLKHGANPNSFINIYKTTPLHYAAKDGHLEIVMTLLKNGANPGVVNVEGITPLHFAVQSGHLEIVTALVKHGVNIHVKDKNNATPLYYAAENGQEEVAAFLIKNGSEINGKADNNFTPLHIAAREGHKDVADLLMKCKALVNSRDIKGGTPLHATAVKGSKDIIDLLIKNKAEVNAKINDGITPLHIAALNGNEEAVEILIKNKAEVNAKADHGLTPLHSAIIQGHKGVVNLLIKNKAQVDVRTIENNTSLDIAVEGGHKEIVEILATNGANVNGKSKNLTSLLSAVRHNRKDIVEVLIANGASVIEEGSNALSLAIFAGYTDIVEIFLKNEAYVNMKDFENYTPLHWAATRGHKRIVKMLISRGANVDATNFNNVTPLHIAAQGGYEEFVEILIAGGANVNVKSNESLTPIHMAASNGNNNVVKNLLANKAQINVKDNKNRTALELAVSHGHLQVVKMLLQYQKVDMDAKGNDDYTILHIASQENNLEMVKYLINEGCNINARNAFGSKPIHIAAREGSKDIVKLFLDKGLSVNDLGADNQILLHYAAMKGHLEVVKYLITQGADVNVKDNNGLTPMHIAANFGYKGVIEVLLQNGAVYNAIDKFNRRPLKMANNKGVIDLLASTAKLFEAVKRNNSSEVENYIKAGAFVDAKNADSGTPLHYAAWKGYDAVVNILLHYKANPNIVGNKGWTPLHYAAKFSHIKVVKALLSNNAVYNTVSDGGKTPLDFSVDENVSCLFKLLNESFLNIKNGNSQVVCDLTKMTDVDTVKAIMRARNRENKTLIVAAVLSNFPKVEQLKEILQGDLSNKINIALVFFKQGKYPMALSIFKSVFEKRKEILGSDNPGTLDIQTYIAKVLYKQGAYREALDTFEEILQKQTETLGLNDKVTISTRSFIGLVLHRLGRDEEALNIYQEVYPKQKEILGSNHSDTLDTQFYMALVFERRGKYEEALIINRYVFKKRKETLGANHPNAVFAQNNIAMVLASQGNYEEALKIYNRVYEKKKLIFGINHPDTLRTLHNIAGALSNQKKYQEALAAHQEVLNMQKNVLGPNHPETLNSQYNLARVLDAQGKWNSALKVYTESLDQMKAVFGPSHSDVLDVLKRIERLDLIFKLEGKEASKVVQYLQKDIIIAACNGDIETVQILLKDGVDVNDKDIDGRTLLHYAINNAHIGLMNILLKNGADVTRFTNKGNTPLHTAALKGCKESVDVLLQHVSLDKLNDLINAKTAAGGATSLHVAAKNGSLDVVKSLLERGAIYDVTNNEGKTPLDLCKEKNVGNLLKLIEELFKGAKNGSTDKFRVVKPDEVAAVTNARNNEGNTLLEVVIANVS